MVKQRAAGMNARVVWVSKNTDASEHSLAVRCRVTVGLEERNGSKQHESRCKI